MMRANAFGTPVGTTTDFCGKQTVTSRHLWDTAGTLADASRDTGRYFRLTSLDINDPFGTPAAMPAVAYGTPTGTTADIFRMPTGTPADNLGALSAAEQLQQKDESTGVAQAPPRKTRTRNTTSSSESLR